MAVHVAMALITIQLYEVRSLKEKRGLRKSLCDRLKRRYNVSLSEVDHMDSKRYLTLGIAAISNSSKVNDGMFSKILHEIEYHHDCDVVNYEQTEL